MVASAGGETLSSRPLATLSSPANSRGRSRSETSRGALRGARARGAVPYHVAATSGSAAVWLQEASHRRGSCSRRRCADGSEHQDPPR
mmetsp:Transcript_15359/g.41475  ORF Transcript_15359/g.41475 Transcript_15359/m.41475 type:complete len:88 (-) Transcript_15359:813-1076(-)